MSSSFMSLPFWIPRGLGVVDGIARVCESELVLEFDVKESMFRIGTREVVLPFEEIESVAFKRRGLLRNALLFSARRLHPASSVPGSRAGQFALYIYAREQEQGQGGRVPAGLRPGPQRPEQYEGLAGPEPQKSPDTGRHHVGLRQLVSTARRAFRHATLFELRFQLVS